MSKIVVIDANSLLYRAFFALPFLSTASGEPTNAVYGFAMMVTKLLDEEKPDYAVAAFEGGKTFRHESYAEYKSHRPETPDDLKSQGPLTHELLDALGIPILITPGYEADDVVGTVAREASEQGMEVLIVTGDLDTLQLISKGTRVMTNKKGITETVIYDREAVRERFGLDPEQLPDYKALKGDASDNIPGVPGVGDKTATELVARFGNIETLLERADEIEKPKLRESIKTYAGQIVQAKHLATIVTDIAVDFDVANPPEPHPNPQALLNLYKRLEFRVLARKLEDKTRPSETANGTLAFDEVPPPPTGCKLVHSSEDLTHLRRRIETAGECAIRLHRTGSSPLDADLAGISFAIRPGEGAYVSLQNQPEEVGDLFAAADISGEWSASLSDFAPILENENIAKHGHDLKADIETLLANGVTLRGLGTDVMLLAYLLAPGKGSYKLETIAREVVGIELETEDRKKNAEPSQEQFCREADVVISSIAPLTKMLRDQTMTDLLVNIEKPLLEVLAEMEMHGVSVDVDWLRKLSSELEHRIATVEQEVYELAGLEFNIGSPKQLQEVLFEKLQIPTGKKTKTGFSTGSEVLEDLVSKHEIAGKILHYRELSKLKSTYTDALVKLISPKTGRIHTSLNQAVTATGRLSSSEPNLQNIPVRTQEGREIRKGFIPCAGMELISADYSQIELRILAHMSQDESMMEAFRNREDIHTHTASLVFEVPEHEVTSEMRRRAKAVNFGIVYGISDFGLARDLQIPVKQAAEYIKDYFERFPGVKHFIDQCIATARERGYVETMLGRRRYLPDIRSSNRNFRMFAERNAVNSPIQGTAADIIKIAMINMCEEILKAGLDMRMILQVHDELLFEVMPKELDQAARLAKRVMEEAIQLSVPVEVDVKHGKNWAEMTGMKL